MSNSDEKSLYERLGGYDAISAWPTNYLGAYGRNRGDDGITREKQLLIDFLCASAGGPMYYTGRDMKLIHKRMRISEADWQAFLGHLNATLHTGTDSSAGVHRKHQGGHHRDLERWELSCGATVGPCFPVFSPAAHDAANISA